MFESAVTMNKYISKKICGDAGLNVAKSVLVRSSQATIDIDKMVKILGLPCFVKPNNGGSSVATTKAYTKAQLVNGMEEAFQHDDEVIVEQFIKGREVTCGVFFNGKDIVALPVTEIIPLNDFFDYEAKYEGKSNEVTPAEINANTYKKIQEKTIEVYRLLNLSGMVRIDFMLKGATPYFMEVNTIPGFSKASIIPQQIRAAGLKESNVITMLIEQTLRQKK
jgi:D-alanine-D-alanine ligase